MFVEVLLYLQYIFLYKREITPFLEKCLKETFLRISLKHKWKMKKFVAKMGAMVVFWLVHLIWAPLDWTLLPKTDHIRTVLNLLAILLALSLKRGDNNSTHVNHLWYSREATLRFGIAWTQLFIHSIAFWL